MSVRVTTGVSGSWWQTRTLQSSVTQRLTLSVIAYRQPVSRGQVSSIRGVNVDSVVRTLISRGLVAELYTDAETGAAMFGTTQMLLEVLGINSLDELPAISPYLPDQDSID